MDGSQRTSLCNLAEMFIGTFLMSHSDEHQKRSPDCSFFTLYASIKPKSGRPKKSRLSKASRMSTQSNLTAVSEGVSIAENEANLDETIMSTAQSVKPTKTAKGGTKASRSQRPARKANRKAAKTKEEESQIASSFLEPGDDDFEVKVAPSPAVVVSSNKRKSDNIEVDSELPAAKRRNTRARASVAQAQETAISAPLGEDTLDTHITDVKEMSLPSTLVSQKKGKGSKKRASSTTRKASTTSTASKASLRAVVPNDEELDAALEADLARPLTDDEAEAEPIGVEQPKGRRLTRTKPGSKKATASVAPTRRGTRASSTTVHQQPMADCYPDLQAATSEAAQPALNNDGDSMQNCETTELSPQAEKPTSNASPTAPVQRRNHDEYTKAKFETQEDSVAVVDEIPPRLEASISKSQQPRSRQVSRQLPTRNTRASNLPKTHDVVDLASDANSSIVDAQTVQDDSGHETDAGGPKQSRTKFSSKKSAGAKRKAKLGRKAAVVASHIENVMQTPMDEIQREHTSDASTVAAAEKAPVASSPEPSPMMMDIGNTPASPPPPSVHMTPRSVLSPQSSDAENQPPSSRPSTFRPPLPMQSPSRTDMPCIPFAATTPTTSPSKGTFSKLQSILPWTAVDLRHVFNGTPSANKENNPFAFGKATGSTQDELTSPEKNLTVEQWIHFNAERGEERLRSECERLVGKFEDEGLRALGTLEGIVCAQ